MKRLNRSFPISKLGESVSNALKMKTTQMDGDEQRILHYSYNFASDTDQKRHSFPLVEESFGELTRNKPRFRSEQITNALNRGTSMLRSGSFSYPGRYMLDNEIEKASEPPKAKNMLFYGGAAQGYVENFTADFSTDLETNTEIPITENNASGENRTRKVGLGDTTNRGLMSHRLRKIAVCDSSDNFHYQRQFLRVLNKRF